MKKHAIVWVGAVCLLAGCILSSANSRSGHSFPDQCWGVYGRGGKWDPDKVNRQTVPLIKGVNLSVSWKNLEPEPGRFMFDDMLGDRLKAALENDYYLYLVIYFSPDFPGWLQANGVRLFRTEPGMGALFKQHPTVWPCYLEEAAYIEMVAQAAALFNGFRNRHIEETPAGFLTQIYPEQTSVACWHKGPAGSIEGRFARGFDLRADRDTMFFRFDDALIDSSSSGRLLLRVIYLDEGKGAWKLKYTTADGMKTAISHVNAGSGEWKQKDVVVDDARMTRSGPRGSDLVLTGDGSASVFHMIEVEKVYSENIH